MSSENNIPSEKVKTVEKPENATTDDEEEVQLSQYAKNAMTQTVEKYFAYTKFRLFKEALPEIYKENKSELKAIYDQFLNQLKSSFLEEANTIYNAENLDSSLSTLGTLNKKYEGSNESWRPSGIPLNDLRDHFHQLKLKNKKCLEFYLQTLLKENDEIEKVMKHNHKEIIDIKSRIDDKNKEVKKRLKSMDGQVIKQLEIGISSNIGIEH